MSGGHPHAEPGAVPAAGQRRALWLALAANGGFLIVEVGGGILFGSLALLADAAHLGTDVAGLLIALVAQSLMLRPASRSHSFGLRRAEILGAQLNAALMVAACAWILVEAARRVGDAPDVAGGGVAAVAVIGLAVNVASALMLRRVAGRDVNMRAAVLHMSADALGSLGALVAGLLIAVGGPDWLDPAVSVGIAALVLRSAVGLVRETTRVLLEATPTHLDAAEVISAMAQVDGVVGVHHLHLWTVSTELTALSAHVVVAGSPSLLDGQRLAGAVRRVLAESFGIDHATLELECEPCADGSEPADCDPPPRPGGG